MRARRCRPMRGHAGRSSRSCSSRSRSPWPSSSPAADGTRRRTRMLLVDVALPVPVPRAFTYVVPDALARGAGVGARVVCPLGSRRVVGVVLAAREGEPPEGTKPLAGVLDDVPAVPADLVTFLR